MFKCEQTVSARNERINRWANPFVRSWPQYSTSVQRSRTKQRRPIRGTFRSWNLPERSEGDRPPLFYLLSYFLCDWNHNLPPEWRDARTRQGHRES